ncbi:MAG: Crp/Fnr family transcriptional regulator [Anaerolineae bacterium]
MSYTYLLRNVSLFSQLNEDELDALSAEFLLQTFRRGQVLFRQGSTTSAFYIVKSGSIQITALGRDAEVTFTNTYRAEEHFGEYALMDGLPRSGEAVAMEQSDLLVLTRPNFFRFLEKHPTVAIKLLTTVSRRMRFAESAVDKPMERTSLQKIARLLLTAAAHYQVVIDGVSRLSIRLSSDDLAALAGVTRTDAHDVVDQLRNVGAISMERAHIAAIEADKIANYLSVPVKAD